MSQLQKNTSAASGKTASVSTTSEVTRSGLIKKSVYALASISVVTLIAVGAYSKFGSQLNSSVSQRIVVVPNPSASAPPTPEVSREAPVVEVAQVENTHVEVSDPASVTSPDAMAPPPSIALNAPSIQPVEVEPPPPPKKVTQPAVQKPSPKPVAVKPLITTPAKVIPKDTQQPKPAIVSSNIDSRYLSGDVESLLKEMNQMVASSRSSDSAYQDKYNKLLKMYNKYTSGKQAMIEGRKEQAITLWDSFLKDERAMFGSKKSVMASSVSSKLVDEYVSLGNNAAKAGKHHDAYKYWQKSISFGDSVPAKIAVDAANQKSKQLYRQALRLEYVNTARAKELWRQVMELVPPGTEYYTKASSKLAWYDKWGA